jgi:hypothetical protein
MDGLMYRNSEQSSTVSSYNKVVRISNSITAVGTVGRGPNLSGSVYQPLNASTSTKTRFSNVTTSNYNGPKLRINQVRILGY